MFYVRLLRQPRHTARAKFVLQRPEVVGGVDAEIENPGGARPLVREDCVVGVTGGKLR